MSFRTRVWIATVAAFLVVACGGDAAEPTATAPSTSNTLAPSGAVSPTATATPTVAATAPPEPATAVPAAPPTAESGFAFLLPEQVAGGDISDYRARYEFHVTFEGDVLPPDVPPEVTLWDMTMDVVLDPPARRIVMGGYATQSMLPSDEGVTPVPGDQIFEMVQIEDTAWVRFGDEWFYMTGMEVDDPTEDLEGFEQAFPADAPWERVGTETVSGMRTVHYTAEVPSEALTAWFDSTLEDSLTGIDVPFTDAEIDRVSADVYVTEDDLLVRGVYHIVWRAQYQGSPVTVSQEITYELEGINLGITIEPPEMPAVQSTVPVPEGATLSASMAGMKTYAVSGMSVDDVVAFYVEALPASGFTVTSSFTQPGQGGFIEAAQDGTTYTVMVFAEDGDVMVTILEGSQ